MTQDRELFELKSGRIIMDEFDNLEIKEVIWSGRI
jgi:hypothetical protein